MRDTSKRYLAALGGEGGGKTVAGIIRDLERIRAGCNGLLVSPDLPHFKRSLWPEFKRWCPWDWVVDSQQRRQALEWEPTGPFAMVFKTGAVVYCGGIENPMSWEGPNMNWAHFDEPRKQDDPAALKVLDGRVRIMGPKGQPPQLWLTTTPRMNWLYDYFGPIMGDEDPRLAFKRDSLIIHLLTKDNEENLEPDFVRKRSQTLTEAEIRVLLEAQWEDIDSASRFMPSMTLWDACKEPLPPLGAREPMVVCADAGVSNDHFGLVGITRHPDKARHDQAAERYAMEWKAPPGGQIDFHEPDAEIRRLCKHYNVVQFCYDAWQLVDMGQRLKAEGVVWVSEFPQGSERLEADKMLLDLVVGRRFAHDGHEGLRAAIDNADRKPDPETRKLRIVKRDANRKVDLAVACSMATYRCLTLNL